MATKDHPKKIGSYEIVEPLDKIGRVFKGTDPTSGRIVAVKIAPAEYAQDPERVEEFQRLAEAVAKVEHPHVVRVFDHGEADGIPFVVMEFVEGTTLAELMKRRRPTLQEALAVFKAVVEGLEAAHREQIVHRDLNPDNILVTEDLRVVKLADFGLGKAESLSKKMGSLTTDQLNMGSLHYMSPEQASRTGEVDQRTDIYSSGVLFYELLTGRVPIGRFSLPSQLNNEVPPEVDPVILRCLETRPADRFQTTAQLLQGLSQIEDHLRLGLMQELQGFSTSTSKILVNSATKMLGGKGPLVLGGVLAVVVVAILLFLLLKKDEAPSPPEAATEVAQAVEEAAAPAPDAAVEESEPTAEMQAGDEVSQSEEEGEVQVGAPVVEAVDPMPGPAAVGSEIEPQPVAEPVPAGPGPEEIAAAERAARAAQAEEDLRVAIDKFAAALYEPAISDLQSFLATYPDHPRQAEVYLTIGKAHEAKGAAQQALASYVEVQSRFPASAEAVEARFLQADLTAKERGRDAEARQLYTEFIQSYPNHPLAPRALAGRAALETEMQIEVVDASLGRVPAALASWQALVDTYPTDLAVERALWELGRMWSDLRQYERAGESFAELGRRFPNTSYDAWWEAGQVYDRRLNDRIRAIAAYENVPTTSRHFRDAQRRIQRLN